ncbi:hypothetical protein [Streptomyces sp. GZWMJZ-114]|uniref:hypothetical protein n=1 Tax=Streptomyces sp. GZWMJZ-114 TaxID=2494734 RepID=UPI0010110DC5|nr:hypothetical protein [Streptomyces sp. GZWMJZ-114]
MTQSLGHDPLHKPQWQNLFVEPPWPTPVEAALSEEETGAAGTVTASPVRHGARGHAPRRGA